MKLSLFLFFLTILIPSFSFAGEVDEYANDDFHLKPHYTLGAGTFPFSNQTLYVTSKVSFLDYGPSDEGLQFLGAGVAFAKDEFQVMLSPIIFYQGHFAISGDISLQALGWEHGHKQDLAGVSFNYNF